MKNIVEPRPKSLGSWSPPKDGGHYVQVTVTPNMLNAGIDPRSRLLAKGFEIVPESISKDERRCYMRLDNDALQKIRSEALRLAESMERRVSVAARLGVEITRVESTSETVTAAEYVADMNR